MIELTHRLNASDPAVQPHAQLELPFELRQKTRLRTRLKHGEDVWVMLPRGTILRGGDRLGATDGRIVQVIAQPEQLLHVECETPRALARAAYHLGNRHIPLEVLEGSLRLAADHVLEHMLLGLGARVTRIEAPFEPEAGAYGAHTHNQTQPDEERRPGRIHEYATVGSDSLERERLRGVHNSEAKGETVAGSKP